MLVVLLSILPCLLLAPVVIIGVGVVLPLWIVSVVLAGAAWLVVTPLDLAFRAAGSELMASPRKALERALYWLTHPTIPERWRRRSESRVGE